MRRIASLLAVLGLLSGCVTVRREPPKPEPLTQTLDLGPLLEQQAQNGTVLVAKEQGLMKRVLLGPNLVFESSRSSAPEPRVIGPKGDPFFPLDDALGIPIDMPSSSMLIRYLSERGAQLVVPALSKRWDAWNWWWCGDDKDGRCHSTWVERLLQAAQDPGRLAALVEQRKKDARDAKDGRDSPPAPIVEELPTSAMAVRMLGLSEPSIPVVVIENPKTHFLELRVRATPHQPSMCGPDLRVPVPRIGFQAEFISLREGRLLARINDVRPIQVGPSWVQQSVAMTEVQPVYASGAERLTGDPEIRAWKQSPVSCLGWDEKGQPANCHPVVCDSVERALSNLIDELRMNQRRYVQGTMQEVLKNNLDPLF